MSPCRAPAEKPCFSRERCRIATSRLRLQKMIAFLKLSAERISERSVSRFSAWPFGSDQNLANGRGGRGGPGNFDAHRIVQEGFGQPRDLRRHGGREEQRLAREGHQLADALDVGDEAHVEHAVGLVDDEDLDAGQEQLAAIEEVEQASRRGDEHVGAAHDFGFLVAESDAADQEGDVQFVICAVNREGSPQPARRVRASAPG